MSEGGPRGGDVLATLLAINQEVATAGQEMERLARLTELPDAAVLSTARLRFSRALRRHLQYVDQTVLTQLRGAVDDYGPVTAYRRLLQDYHEAAAHHVARWPSTSVTADWHGYRRSVADMLDRLGKRVEAERRDIYPLLDDAGPRRS